MKITCKACKGTGKLDTEFAGISTCTGCEGSGKHNCYWFQFKCYDCDGSGKDVRYFQGELEKDDGDIEFSLTEFQTTCNTCNGKGTTGINPWTILMKIFRKYEEKQMKKEEEKLKKLNQK